MTSTPPPQPGPDRPVLPVLRPLRDLAAYALVAAPAVWLFVAVIRLVPSGVGQDFLTRAQTSFYSFVNVETVLFPLAAVLLATLVTPRHRHARLITVVALAEYAVAAGFAVLFGFLIAIVKLAGFSVRVAFEEVLVRAAWLAVLALAGFAVFSIWRALYQVSRPAPQPGMYGQPQQPWGQQPGFPPGQPHPGQPHPAHPHPGQPHPGQSHSGQPHPGQPQPGQPQPGQPYPGQPFSGPPFAGQPQPGQQAWGQPTGWGQPAAPPASAPPAAGSPAATAGQPPAPATPGSSPAAPPGPFAPAPGNPYAGAADPTQVVPAGDEPTRPVGEDPQRGS